MEVCDGDTIIIEPTSLRANEPKNQVEKKLCSYKVKLSPKYRKIRLLGIDAFEYHQNEYGPKAKDFLSMLILNKQVCFETDVQVKDIYGRTLGYVFINEPTSLRTDEPMSLRANGLAELQRQLFINEELLKNGYAILYDFPPNIKYIDKLKKAQRYACQNMLGVWEKNSYILETPSSWRHGHYHR